MGICGSRQLPTPPSSPLIFEQGFQPPLPAPYQNAAHSSSFSPLIPSSDDTVLDLTNHISKIGAAITSGRFCDVYYGELGPNRIPVAIKVFRAAWGAQWVGQISHHVLQALPGWVQVQHRRVAQFLGWAMIDDAFAVITRWCPNGTVMEYLRQNPLTNRIALVCQVAEGLRHLHSLDEPIVHGNLKPMDILIDSNFKATICDFALSEVMIREFTDETAVDESHSGVRYGAPELLAGQPCTRESDVYAFACVALEILTGKMPYVKTNNSIYVKLAKTCGQAPLPQDYPELSPAHPVWRLLRKCWDADPSQRPTMSQVSAELDGLRH